VTDAVVGGEVASMTTSHWRAIWPRESTTSPRRTP
jgi:hypothetical protein